MTDTTTPIREATPVNAGEVRVRQLGLAEYQPTWHAMQALTAARGTDTPDEIWMLQHPPVYTLGVAGKAEHLPRIDNGIPVVRTDRGGQITYHGPGQIVAYLLLDMRRRGLSVHGREDAPGVYVGAAKIAALGLRIRNGCCYHGIALNVDMDLAPFHAINPCGYPGLSVIQMRDLGIGDDVERIGAKITQYLIRALR